MRFCRLVAAQPYLAVNLRTLPARSFTEWLEYCNSPAGSTTLAEQRAVGGEREPFGVRYWGIGNESWGGGGNFTPEEYAAEYRRFATWAVPAFGVGLAFIGAGPNGGGVGWTRRVFPARGAGCGVGRVGGVALPPYSAAPPRAGPGRH